jgi:hypothetical protein
MATITDIAEGDETKREAAYDFMRRIGLEPTPDAIGQLSGPFAHALAIMCTRGYDREGTTWRNGLGWRGLVNNILDNADRLKWHSWDHRDFDGDSVIDMINFGGMYWRLGNKGPAWGKRGEPG